MSEAVELPDGKFFDVTLNGRHCRMAEAAWLRRLMRASPNYMLADGKLYLVEVAEAEAVRIPRPPVGDAG